MTPKNPLKNSYKEKIPNKGGLLKCKFFSVTVILWCRRMFLEIKKDSLSFVSMPLAPSPRWPWRMKMAQSDRAFCAMDTVAHRQQNHMKRSQRTKQTVIILGEYQPGPNSNWQHSNENEYTVFPSPLAMIVESMLNIKMTNWKQVPSFHAKREEREGWWCSVLVGFFLGLFVFTLPPLSKICSDVTCHWNKVFLNHEPCGMVDKALSSKVYLGYRGHASAPEPITNAAMWQSTGCTAAALIQRHAHENQKYVCLTLRPSLTLLFHTTGHHFMCRAGK